VVVTQVTEVTGATKVTKATGRRNKNRSGNGSESKSGNGNGNRNRNRNGNGNGNGMVSSIHFNNLFPKRILSLGRFAWWLSADKTEDDGMAFFG